MRIFVPPLGVLVYKPAYRFRLRLRLFRGCGFSRLQSVFLAVKGGA